MSRPLRVRDPRVLTVTLTLVLLVLGLGAPGAEAQPLGTVQPTWEVRGPSSLPGPGEAFEVVVEVTLPAGYYQDADSPFLAFEPTPDSGLRVVNRWSSTPAQRQGKASYTGTFTLGRTVVWSASPSGSASFTLGWQICQVDGVCLLPATAPVSWPPTSSEATVAPVPPLGFWAALLAALVGGLVLNLMPCVFPVLALKALALGAPHADRRSRLVEAWASAGGTVGALGGLGLVTAAAALGGQRLDWGFAFQSPLFVWTLALVFWALCLQLWGVWSWSWSPFGLRSLRRGPGASALGGAFLVVAAAPCTAPFLGPALGFALTLPAGWIPAFFLVAGLGLAAPLLVVQLVPRLAKLVPRPGPWMVTVEKVAGFALAGTVIYLLWVLTKQTEADRVWPALALLGVAAAALGWGARPGASKSGRVTGLMLALVLVGTSPWLAGSFERSPALADEVPAQPRGWQRFSSADLEAALAQGRPVFVDATAAWCVTCQVNERAVLLRSDVSRLFEEAGVLRLRADYTLPDPEVKAWLEDVGRAGLPVYALYRPGASVQFFPELLTDDNFTRVLPRILDGKHAD